MRYSTMLCICIMWLKQNHSMAYRICIFIDVIHLSAAHLQCLMLLVRQQELQPVKKLSDGMLALSGVRCRFAYGPADATATHYLLLQ